MVAEPIIVLLGATGAAVVNGILDAYAWEWFPEYAAKPLFGIEPLPSVNQWAVLGGSLVPFLAGHFMKQKTVKSVGEGALLYSAPMIMHHMVVRAAAEDPTKVIGYAMVGDPRLKVTYVPVTAPRGKYAAPPAPAVTPTPMAPAAVGKYR